MNLQLRIRVAHLVRDFQRRLRNRFRTYYGLRFHTVLLGEPLLLAEKALFKEERDGHSSILTHRLRHLRNIRFKLFEPGVDLRFDASAAEQLESQCHASSPVVLIWGRLP